MVVVFVAELLFKVRFVLFICHHRNDFCLIDDSLVLCVRIGFVCVNVFVWLDCCLKCKILLLLLHFFLLNYAHCLNNLRNTTQNRSQSFFFLLLRCVFCCCLLIYRMSIDLVGNFKLPVEYWCLVIATIGVFRRCDCWNVKFAFHIHIGAVIVVF